MTDNIALYRSLLLIRRFEETVLENFPSGIFFGTTHSYLGQEANAVGVLNNLLPDDIVFSNHRCHGHFLAYGGDPRALFAELMGKASGVCGGRGGSQHLHFKDFYSNGVQGGIVPIATGMALAEKMKESGHIVVAFLGDGTLGEGIIYEAFNMASLWAVPILYVVEDNQIAQTTPSSLAIAGKIRDRFTAFGIPCSELDTSDVVLILEKSSERMAEIRQNNRPQALVIQTCRFGPHSKGDDTRSMEMIEQMRRERDPLPIQSSRLTKKEVVAVHAEVEEKIRSAFETAKADPFPEIAP